MTAQHIPALRPWNTYSEARSWKAPPGCGPGAELFMHGWRYTGETRGGPSPEPCYREDKPLKTLPPLSKPTIDVRAYALRRAAQMERVQETIKRRNADDLDHPEVKASLGEAKAAQVAYEQVVRWIDRGGDTESF